MLDDILIGYPTVCRWQQLYDIQQISRIHQLKFWPYLDVVMMQQAIKQAQFAAEIGEIPVGAVLVHENQILAKGYNCPIVSQDPTAHAEIVALRKACQKLNNYRLPKNTTLYVTLEPCTMCFGALVHARISRIVFATYEPKSGVVGSRLDLSKMDFYNHKLKIEYGLFSHECSALLSDFFRKRRQIKRQAKLCQH